MQSDHAVLGDELDVDFAEGLGQFSSEVGVDADLLFERLRGVGQLASS